MISLRLPLIIAIVSCASLLLELALTRLFSVVLFYHFAFLAISVALLGLGASTSAQTSKPEPARMAQNEDAMARTINPPAPQSQPDGSAQAPPSTITPSPDESSEDTPTAAGQSTDRGDAQGRSVTAGDNGPES